MNEKRIEKRIEKRNRKFEEMRISEIVKDLVENRQK